MTWLRRSAEPGALDLGGHMLLTTFRANGEPVATPVWNLVRADGTIAMWTAAGTGKWKRIQRNPRVTVQACDPRGRVKRGSLAHSGTAQVLPDGAEAERLRAEIMRNHRGQVALVKRIARLQGRLKADQEFGDTIIVITLDQPPRKSLQGSAASRGKGLRGRLGRGEASPGTGPTGQLRRAQAATRHTGGVLIRA